MLQRLIIRDFVIVEQLELEFADGFGALTGETGAGKSILVDALSLALGERGDAEVIREGAQKAEVSAEFAVTADGPLAEWLAANDFDSDSCILRRVIDASGRSRAWLNGTAATLGQLRQAAEYLCDIHGQHAHHQLLRADAQRKLLDVFANAQAQANEVMQLHGKWRKLSEARQAAEADQQSAARETELLEWQVKELSALAFDAEEWQETEQEHSRLANGVSLLEASDSALAILDEGDEAAMSSLAHASSRLTELTSVDIALTEAAQLFDSALIQLDEAAAALRRYRERLDLDPARLSELEARIDSVMQMARKHRVSPPQLPAVLASMSTRLEQLQLSADPKRLAVQEQQAAQAYLGAARQLSAQRQRAAQELMQSVTQAMQQLAMKDGSFVIDLSPLPEAEGAAHGLENIEFLFSAHAGQVPRALAKVASGGELSRIGLALQVIGSQGHAATTLIFDEVDVGIGGRVAEIVGRMLRQLASDRQVLCVTHLPQVAACADWQWSISKESSAIGVSSRVTVLDASSRVDELARMLGGVNITETTRKHAQELLDGGYDNND